MKLDTLTVQVKVDIKWRDLIKLFIIGLYPKKTRITIEELIEKDKERQRAK